MDETGIDGLVELPETADKTNRALSNFLVRVGEWKTWELSEQTNARAKTRHHAAVETVLAVSFCRG